MDQGFEAGARLWQLADAEYDERTGQLQVGGVIRALEPIPRALLLLFLQSGTAQVRRTALIGAGWGANATASDPSVHSAISKLRRSLGATAGALIEGVGREGMRREFGYRLSRAASVTASPVPPKPLFEFAAGDPVPARPPWRLCERRPGGRDGAAWIAVHPNTGERHAFTFAVSSMQIAELRGALEAWHRLRERVDSIELLVPILDADLEAQPAWLEADYPGQDLAAWEESAGGLKRCRLRSAWVLPPTSPRLWRRHMTWGCCTATLVRIR